MKKCFFVLVLTNLSLFFYVAESSSQIGPKFQAFLTRYISSPDSLRDAIADSCMAAIPSFPFIENDTLACFIFQDSAVTVILNLSGYQKWFMGKLIGKNLWYKTCIFKADAILRYKFEANGQKLIDPLNPNIYEQPNGPISLIKMPEYQEPLEILYYPEIPHGTLIDTTLQSTNLEQLRTIHIYTPPSYDATLAAKYPVTVFNDGDGYIDYCDVKNILDYLIAENRIQPNIAVFIDPINRAAEYVDTDIDKYSAFIIDELLPFIDLNYNASQLPENRAVIGFSYSGHFSTYISFNNPDVFGLCAAQSPSYWVNNKQLYNHIISQPPKNIRFYIDWGIYEPAIMQDALPFTNHLIDLGYDVGWNEWHDGHGTVSFRSHLDNALEYLLPGSASGVFEDFMVPLNYSMTQNYPNPFNPTTTIEYTIPKVSMVRVLIFDVLGRQIKVIEENRRQPGHYFTTWNGTNNNGDVVASGVYFCKIEAGDFLKVIKLAFVR